MNIGDRVKVTAPVTVYHHPQHKGQPVNLEGSEGTIVEILRDWHGRPVSSNYPYKVELGKKFFAHFAESEISPLQA